MPRGLTKCASCGRRLMLKAFNGDGGRQDAVVVCVACDLVEVWPEKD